MAFDTKAFFAEAGFSEADIAELSPRFTDEHSKKLEGMVLRQADYSREMNAAKKAKADLDSANTRLNAELAEWAEQKARDGVVTAKQQKDLDAAQEKAFKAEQVARRIATQAGLDPDELLAGVGATVPPKPKEPAQFDASGLVPKDQFGQAMRSMLHLTPVLMRLDREHQKLTGEPLDTEALIRELETRANTRGNTKSLEPEAIWHDLHDIPNLRETKAKEKYDADITAAVARGREQALTEASIPGQPPPGRGPSSPVLHPGGQVRTSVLQRAQPGTTVQRGVQALRSGKHRESTTAQK